MHNLKCCVGQAKSVMQKQGGIDRLTLNQHVRVSETGKKRKIYFSLPDNNVMLWITILVGVIGSQEDT